MYTPNYYPPKEEKFNIISHAIGFLLSIVGLILLITKANEFGEFKHALSFTIYGISMAILYAASTLFHSATKLKYRRRLNIFDHAAIYIFIAGTYTPFTLVTLSDSVGFALFIVIWSIALLGVIFKLFFIGRFKILSTIAYVLMGWIVVFAIKPLIESLPSKGLLWLLLGGIAYTIGAIFYSLDKYVKFNHGIFHLFVLAGSFCHFWSIYFYVLII